MSKLTMPKIDRKLISKKVEVIANLKKIIIAENVLDHEDELRPFETDALSAYKQKPLAVVFPENKIFLRNCPGKCQPTNQAREIHRCALRKYYFSTSL